MQMSRRMLLLSLWLVLFGGMAARAEEAPLKVLFIGNSYTFANDLPGLVVALADSAGGRKIEVGQHLVGGCTLDRHVRDGNAVRKIREKKWDVVVLQEHSLGPITDRESMHAAARTLHEETRNQGAKTVFYLTWARQNIPQMQQGAEPAAAPDYARAMFKMSGVMFVGYEDWCAQHRAALANGLEGGYFEIARELRAGIAPVGVAWRKALAADRSLSLHQADKSHPNPKGSYLAACVFYATLLDKSPVGLTGECRKGILTVVKIAPEEAKRLQEFAWEAVQESKRRN